LSVVDGLDDYADRDLVIEAVFEDVDLKREVFTRLDAILAASAGFASNTSSISIASLRASSECISSRPSRECALSK
jgi:3-hydroxybutyryl-CoA dehydrogenase